MVRCDPAPALHLWLGNMGLLLPTRLPRAEWSLAGVACALHVFRELFPGQLCVEEILMRCFLGGYGGGPLVGDVGTAAGPLGPGSGRPHAP